MTEVQIRNAYSVQIISIYATHRRHSGKVTSEVPPDPDESAAEPEERSSDFRRLFSGQVPHVINRSGKLSANQIRFASPDGEFGEIDEVLSAKLEIYALPFPADQVVAALIIDLDCPDMNTDSSLAASVLELCGDMRVQINDTDLDTYIDDLALKVNAKPAVEPNADADADAPAAGDNGNARQLPIERHQLVLIGDLRDTEAPKENVVKQFLYHINPPYRPEFTELKRPEGLNQRESTFGAVSPAISFLYGHLDDVENSVFLTTIQAVGTASRFQQIWQEAYRQVRKFQVEKQAKKAGEQKRKDLETLADEMGNLELDLAFSVETAADLGLRIPSSQIDSFHRDLYEVMQIRTRAHTVSQMFIRLGGSIRSELTAIESRESQQDEARRLRGAAAFGALSFVIAPISFVIGFFGINASQIHAATSMWNWHFYHWAYISAAILALVPVFVFLFLYGKEMWGKWRGLVLRDPVGAGRPAPPAQ
jgi:hypothetical protein